MPVWYTTYVRVPPKPPCGVPATSGESRVLTRVECIHGRTVHERHHVVSPGSSLSVSTAVDPLRQDRQDRSESQTVLEPVTAAPVSSSAGGVDETCLRGRRPPRADRQEQTVRSEHRPHPSADPGTVAVNPPLVSDQRQRRRAPEPHCCHTGGRALVRPWLAGEPVALISLPVALGCPVATSADGFCEGSRRFRPWSATLQVCWQHPRIGVDLPSPRLNGSLTVPDAEGRTTGVLDHPWRRAARSGSDGISGSLTVSAAAWVDACRPNRRPCPVSCRITRASSGGRSNSATRDGIHDRADVGGLSWTGTVVRVLLLTRRATDTSSTAFCATRTSVTSAANASTCGRADSNATAYRSRASVRIASPAAATANCRSRSCLSIRPGGHRRS